jgi:sigma-B regulation protein RsbU (phosphoserine phosphatase)
MTLSRRGVKPPKYLVTRFTEWENAADPWSERDRLPLLEGGLLGELVYCNEPRLINDLHVDPADPSYPYLSGMGSILTMPQYDHGEAMTMTMLMRAERNAFNPAHLGEYVWTVNLFGRAVHTLRLSDELEKANAALDRELLTVSNIQRSLLPPQLPSIPGVDLAVHYETARRAGGDYYDFFDFGDGRWGILIADVCGHGADAAVLMAITHAIARTCTEAADDPAVRLGYINEHLFRHYTERSRAFVTAFYGVYDTRTHRFAYASAGHDSPRVLSNSGGTTGELESGKNLPLGVAASEQFQTYEHQFAPGDTIVFFTDGITEARRPGMGQFGLERIDNVMRRANGSAEGLARELVSELGRFAQTDVADDDRTLVIMRILADT